MESGLKMTIEEDFPSLKGKGIKRENLFGENGEIPDMELVRCWEVFVDEDIQEHCRDNQKIIEAIDNFQNKWDTSDECINELKEELRLEK